jgi:hypothetical protein
MGCHLPRKSKVRANSNVAMRVEPRVGGSRIICETLRRKLGHVSDCSSTERYPTHCELWQFQWPTSSSYMQYPAMALQSLSSMHSSSGV